MIIIDSMRTLPVRPPLTMRELADDRLTSDAAGHVFQTPSFVRWSRRSKGIVAGGLEPHDIEVSDESRPISAPGPARRRSRWSCLPRLSRRRSNRGRDPGFERAQRVASCQGAPRSALAWPQLVHTSAIRVLDLELEHERPYAVVEWVGVTTLTASVRATGPRSRREAMELTHAMAGALRAAHRLGLPHGRLGPAHVLLAGPTHPKLDFTGAAVGFPELSGASDGAWGNPNDDTAAGEAADLYNLGTLLTWLLTDQGDRPIHQASAGGPDAASALGKLVRDLLTDDPAERPSAREVQERLDELINPMDATGNWVMPGKTLAQSSSLARSDRPESMIGSFGSATLVVDAGVPYLGRFRLLEKLGEGGQGVVHRAEDPSNGSIVAIKILRTDRVDNPMVLRRFRKEARLASREANNPYVVNLLEFNEDDGVPYMVLEFVAGASLGDLLQERVRLGETEALSFMAAVARGLVEAHERGIVHRDIKPSNILLLEPRRLAAEPVPATESFDLDREDKPGPSIASRIRAPRRCQRPWRSPSPGIRPGRGSRSPTSDWPGTSSTPNRWRSPRRAPCWERLTTWRPNNGPVVPWIPGPTTTLWAPPCFIFWPASLLSPRRHGMCFAFSTATTRRPGSRRLTWESARRPSEWSKADPVQAAFEDRYFDAGAMLRDIEVLLHGQPEAIWAIHPRLPECDPERALPFEFRWELESSPRQLWPLVTNTDRLDRAIGFAPVTYKIRHEPGRGVRTFAEGRKAGMVEVGEEHPYEWIEPRKMGVLREYTQGTVSVDGQRQSSWTARTGGGGTTLTHRLWLEPSSWKIRLGSRWGVGVSLRKSLERVYLRIDATLKSQRLREVSCRVDPFEEPAAMPAPRRQRLERLLDRLVEQGIDATIADQLGDHLALAAPQEVARIRPLALAERWGLDPDQVVNACLHGAREGLLELHWDLLCPICRISCQVTDTLRAIAEHARAARLANLRLQTRLRQFDRVDLPRTPRDPRSRPGHLLHRRTGALSSCAGSGPRRTQRADRAGAGATSGLVPAARPTVALVSRLPGPDFRDDPPLGH